MFRSVSVGGEGVDLTGQGIQKYPVDYENSGLSWPLLYNASEKPRVDLLMF